MLVIWGAPRLAPGDRLLAFLAPREDGAWRVVHFHQGLFRLEETSVGPVWVRRLGGERRRDSDPSRPAPDPAGTWSRRSSGPMDWLPAAPGGVGAADSS